MTAGDADIVPLAAAALVWSPLESFALAVGDLLAGSLGNLVSKLKCETSFPSAASIHAVRIQGTTPSKCLVALSDRVGETRALSVAGT